MSRMDQATFDNMLVRMKKDNSSPILCDYYVRISENHGATLRSVRFDTYEEAMQFKADAEADGTYYAYYERIRPIIASTPVTGGGS